MLFDSLLFISFVGLLSCTAFLILLAIAVSRFKRPQERKQAADQRQVSLLKPLCGLEPGLEQNLESFFCQDYLCYEIIFGAHHAGDPALQVLDRVRERHPEVSVQVVLSGEPDRANAKVCSLEKMAEVAHSDYFVISDSDVRVTSDYIGQVVQPLLDPAVGLVTCMYRGVPTGGLWSRLEALGMSVEMTSGVMVANMLEGMRFGLGPTMAVRRDALERAGGMAALADHCADDFLLGKLVHDAGFKVVLSPHVVNHIVMNQRMMDSVLHQVRWMKSTRFSRPKGHVGCGLTFAMPFGLLGLITCWAMGSPSWGYVMLGFALLNRVAEALLAGWQVVGDRLALRFCWLYPLRDLMGFFFWCASFAGTTIVWRGQRYRLQAEGRMVREPAAAAAPETSSEVAGAAD